MTPEGSERTTPTLPILQVRRRSLSHWKRRVITRSASEEEEAADKSSVSGEPDQSCTTDRLGHLSESSDDDTIEVQGWRRDRFFRETFLQSQVCLINLSP